jgi:hypothetical protein
MIEFLLLWILVDFGSEKSHPRWEFFGEVGNAHLQND